MAAVKKFAKSSIRTGEQDASALSALLHHNMSHAVHVSVLVYHASRYDTAKVR